MGDIADMMLEGALCEGCGVYMGNGNGFPQRCGSCRQAARRPPPDARVPCPTCGKVMKAAGLSNHHKDAHGVVLSAAGKTPCTVCGKRVKLAGVADHMRDAHGSAS